VTGVISGKSPSSHHFKTPTQYSFAPRSSPSTHLQKEEAQAGGREEREATPKHHRYKEEEKTEQL